MQSQIFFYIVGRATLGYRIPLRDGHQGDIMKYSISGCIPAGQEGKRKMFNIFIVHKTQAGPVPPGQQISKVAQICEAFV